MALFRRRDVTQAFRNNRHLQQFMLTDVTPTGKILGTGSYGSVEEVEYQHLVCAGKKLHEILLDDGNVGVPDVVRKYEQECQIMSSLRHPNIILFLGLCFFPGTRLPLLVMERLETSLDDLLEHMSGLPLFLKCSVLKDVASGLVYLHNRQPQIIHRDLTAKNVLLTSSLVAKITDMGNSRMIDMRPGQLASTLSRLPGTLVYMPPEALNKTHCYGPSLDIFSFGHLTLYTMTQVFPGNLLSHTFLDPDSPHHTLVARSEVERRGEYMELLEKEVGNHHPSIVQLVRQCLHNVPEQRPSTDEVLGSLQRLKVEVDGLYGGSLVKLDIDKVLLTKEMKMKDKKIEELTQYEERYQAAEKRVEEVTREIDDLQRQLQQQQIEMQLKDGQLRQREMQVKDGQLQQQIREGEEKSAQLVIKNEEIAAMKKSLSDLRSEVEGLEAKLREEKQCKDAEIRRLTEELRRCQVDTAKGVRQGVVGPLQLDCRHGPDMPFGMGGYIQSVVVYGRVYVGGGNSSNDYVVMEYESDSGRWGTLPPYTTRWFGMTAIHNQLVLVGGRLRDYSRSRSLGVWRAQDKKWTHPYPDMPTARSGPSAVTYSEWLVVAGGNDGNNNLSSVEVMNTTSNQWFTAAPTHTRVSDMRTALVGDMWYLMGGFVQGYYSDMVYSVSLPALISQVNSKNTKEEIWKEISGLGHRRSSPLSISGSLLALGWDGKVMTAIHHYQPETGEWVKVGDLISPRCNCACTQITEEEILVAGGWDDRTTLKSTEFYKLL